MEHKFGFPVVNAENVFAVLAELGVRRPVSFDMPERLIRYFDGRLSLAEREEVIHLAARSEVVRFMLSNGQRHMKLRNIDKHCATTFVMFPGDLVAVVGEYKYGCNWVTLMPPSGAPSANDEWSPSHCACRETQEKLGVTLSGIVPLSGTDGLPINGGRSTALYFPFIGFVPSDVQVDPNKLVATEHLKAVLVPLAEWLKLVDRGATNELVASDVTYRALRYLRRI